MQCRGRMAAGDKHESADNVPASAAALPFAVQTPTAGSDRGCHAVLARR